MQAMTCRDPYVAVESPDLTHCRRDESIGLESDQDCRRMQMEEVVDVLVMRS